MKTKSSIDTKYLAILFLFLFSTVFSLANAQDKAVDDNFMVDGTTTTDAFYYGSSNSSAVEVNANSIGLVTGSSGRQMHAIFDTQTLAFVGDMLKATVTFETPATVSTGGDDLRIGLFDHLERIASDQLGQNTSYSTGSPNPLFNGLPGYRVELDVESADPATDLDIRKSNPSDTGRLIATNDEFTAFTSGPDIGYVFEPNSVYTVTFIFQATTGNGLNITTDFIDADGNNISSQTVSDATPFSYSFGMLAMGASTDAFGSTNINGVPDNGIDILKFGVELIESADQSEPVTATIPQEPLDPNGPRKVEDDFATDSTAFMDASYYASSSSSAIEINPNSVGLVSGSSSRQIHALFPTQTLINPGDELIASITFTTPPTVAAGNEDLRLGLFDHLERTDATQLGQNTSYGSSSPNADFQELPGYFFEIDVESTDTATDFDIRKHNLAQDPIATTGRLLSTTSIVAPATVAPFVSLPGSSGPDVGYAIDADTSYTIDLSVVRNETDGIDVSIALTDNELGMLLGELTLTDDAPDSFNFGMLAMGSSSDAFGSSSDNDGGADNGIDITKFIVDLIKAEVEEVGNSSTGVIVDDNLLDDGTTDLDADYYTSSNASAIEFNADSIGLVSGSSGRAIHALFDTQTLEKVGDILRTSVTFVTPDTVAVGGEDFRFGIFDHLGRNTPTQLAQNTSYSSSSPNSDFSGLPGFYLELDVETTSLQSDLDIRKSAPTETGRLINTTGGFLALGNGEDLGYAFEANTEYTTYLEIERLENGELSITGIFLGREFNVIDTAPLSYNFGMLALNASSGAFGSSNVPGEADNGIDLTNVTVEFIRTAAVDDDFVTDGTTSPDGSYFASSTSSAIEFNTDSVGLVSGSSGRQIHTLFGTQTLANTGDTLEVTIDFKTPDTVATTNEELRFGVFDHLDRDTETQLAQNTSFSSGTPNPDFSGLPGYVLELDIESADTETDLQIRRSNPSTSGRLLTTTSGLDSLGDSDDIGYVIGSNTNYTVTLIIERTDADELDISASFLGSMYKATDTAPLSFDFGMLAFYASSGAVGSSNSVGDADNGIDITAVSVNYQPFFEVEEVEIPPIEPPTGDHPDVEIIPEVPGDGGSNDPIDDPDNSVGDSPSGSPLTGGNRVLPAIYGLLILNGDSEPLTDAEKVAQYFGLNPNAKPWDNFDLSDWGLDTPNPDVGPITDAAGNEFGNGDGFSARTQDYNFIAGAQFPGSEPFFFTGSDGAMVFKSTVGGARTSQNTSFVRSELREMLRAGDINFSTQGPGPNNWALGYQPNDNNNNYGGVGGTLTATLSIDQVTTTGVSGQVGRVIIGQIHAEDDEPIRLYYRKLPGNTKGGIYAVSEIKNGDDLPHFNLIGDSSSSAADPVDDGIALGELFSYEIIQAGATIEVVIRRGDKDGEIIATEIIDLTDSGYDVEDEWMYFKAGAYVQDNTGWSNDFAQVRFYRLENSHETPVE